MKPIPEIQRTALMAILADVEALWTPYRHDRSTGKVAAAIAERRNWYASKGMPFVYGGGAAERKAGEREIRALASRGFVRTHGRAKWRGISLTPAGDDYVRSITPSKRVDEAWSFLERIAAAARDRKCLRIGHLVLEHDLVGIRDPKGNSKPFLDFEDDCLPLLCRELLKSMSDTHGCIGYGVTEAGNAALTAGKPKPPAGIPDYDSDLADEYIAMYTAALDSRFLATIDPEPSLDSAGLRELGLNR